MKFLINKYVGMLSRMLALPIFDFGYECYSPLSTIYDYIVAVSSISEGPGSDTTSGTYPWSFVTQIFHSGQPNHGGDRKSFEVMNST
jgi:hypothetical protein